VYQITSNLAKYGIDASTIRGFQKGEGNIGTGELRGKGQASINTRKVEQQKVEEHNAVEPEVDDINEHENDTTEEQNGPNGKESSEEEDWETNPLLPKGNE